MKLSSQGRPATFWPEEGVILFERRFYTLKPGETGRFWEYQERWNAPQDIPRLLERNIGYFESLHDQGSRILMLYRYDDFDDWRSRLFGGVDEERMKYLTAGRAIMMSQENMFLTLSPEDELNPVWNGSSDWHPGHPRFDVADPETVILREERFDLAPGALPRFWDSALAHARDYDATARDGLIGYFPVLVGRQHRVFCYRWHADAADVQRHDQRLTGSEAFRTFQRAFRDDIVAREVRLFRTARVPWMRNLFTTLDLQARVRP